MNLQVPYETGRARPCWPSITTARWRQFPFQVRRDGARDLHVRRMARSCPTRSGKAGDTLLAFITGDGDSDADSGHRSDPAASTALHALPKSRLPRDA